MKKRVYCFLLVFLLLAAGAASAGQVEKCESLWLHTSLLTHHWRNNEDMNNNQNLIALEMHQLDDRVYGLTFFQNSFSQPSWYLYTGKTYNLGKTSYFEIEGKLTYGVIHGYDDEEGRYPGLLNEIGTFPAIVPCIGLKRGNFIIALELLATAGFMITVGLR